MTTKPLDFRTLILLALTPIIFALWVWLSPLAFVPVPWPDDSAFYFVAHELFKWPPRWVMLPQAPFEPTYRIFNFNTMPLYPILIGLGRWIGVDGSFALKIWPLSAWALSGTLIVVTLYLRRLPAVLCFGVALLFSADPILRWASVLVRPESLIGLFGVCLILGLSLGFPKRFHPSRFWDPVAFLLAISAYSHFNAIHLVFPVVLTFLLRPKRLVEIGLKTLLYLSPWILTVLWHFKLFYTQMHTQWSRLGVHNDWLKTPRSAVMSLIQEMGAPENLHPIMHVAAWGLGFMAITAFGWGLLIPSGKWIFQAVKSRKFSLNKDNPKTSALNESLPNLIPSAAWVLGACWLWDSKPEVWFVYYIHLSLWVFTGLALLRCWEIFRQPSPPHSSQSAAQRSLVIFGVLTIFTVGMAGSFVFASVQQALKLSKSDSWRWSTYYDFIDCIDKRLTRHQEELGGPRSFHVWAPTFPDITIELSRRHEGWELTRTNDFWERAPLAIQHGKDVHAVVVPETINWTERNIEGPDTQFPDIKSVWMTWDSYFLNQLWKTPGWKPNRYICQRGRWQAFIFMNLPDGSR